MSTRAQLKRELDAVADRASERLRVDAGRTAFRRARPSAGRLALIVPALALLVQGARYALGFGASWGWVVPVAALAVLVPAAWLGWRWWQGMRITVERAGALGAMDDALASSDRLLAADDFVRRDERSGFMAAALDDAADYVARARTARLPEAQPVPAGMGMLAGGAALALLVAAVWIAGFVRARLAAPEIAPRVPSADLVARAGDEGAEPAPPPATDVPVPVPPAPAKSAAPANAPSGVPKGSTLPDKAREATGRLGSGVTSESDQSSSPSDAQGAPSAQGQPAKPGKSPAKKPPRPKPTKPESPPERNEEQRPPEPAGSTAGQGSSRGSNRNPAVSDWSSRDQVATPDDDAESDEDEVDDEDEEQESRGGVQPNLRDRRPPVNRDLNIGFGNRSDPDANGRGGPSQQKKSRGVASLVLGVPIPDRVKGQPNPGRTKVTQQRVEPRREAGDPTVVGARSARDGTIGRVGRPELTPWMRSLVRAYFLRSRASAAPAPSE